MIPTVLNIYENKDVQTDSSIYDQNTSFNFDNDENIKFEAQIPQVQYEPEMVQGIIRPLTLAPDGTIINHHIPRLFKRKNVPMIRSLAEQIEGNKSFKSEYVRQMAAALIPGLKDKNYHSLFTDPLKIAYSAVDGQYKPNGAIDAIPCKAIFSLDSRLTIQTETQTIQCHIDTWERLTADSKLYVINGEQKLGVLQISQDVEPINFAKGIPKQLLQAFHIESEEQFGSLITENDTSLVDVILSIPTLSSKDANDLLAVLHTRKLLSPYIRSKVCALQLSNPIEERSWPELLGRFIFLLDPLWVYKNIPLLRQNDVMAIFRHIMDMNGGARYVLQVALKTLDETKGSEPLLFFWTLIFMSLLQNATLANKSHADRLRNKMIAMWKELQKKKDESNTRKLTFEIIDKIKEIKQFKLDSVVHEENELIAAIFKEHHDAIFTIIRINPFRREESHPLYFPVVLALETALLQASQNKELISSESESLNGDFESDSSISSRSSKHSQHPDSINQEKIEMESAGSRSSRHSTRNSEKPKSPSEKPGSPEVDPNPDRPFFDAKLFLGSEDSLNSNGSKKIKSRNVSAQIDDDENPTMESDHSYSSRKRNTTQSSSKKTPTQESSRKNTGTQDSQNRNTGTQDSQRSAKKSAASQRTQDSQSKKDTYGTYESYKSSSQKPQPSKMPVIEENDSYYSDYEEDADNVPPAASKPQAKSQYSAHHSGTYSRSGTYSKSGAYSKSGNYSKQGTNSYSTRSSQRKPPPPIQDQPDDYSYTDEEEEQPVYSYSKSGTYGSYSSAKKSAKPAQQPIQNNDGDYSYYSDEGL